MQDLQLLLVIVFVYAHDRSCVVRQVLLTCDVISLSTFKTHTSPYHLQLLHIITDTYKNIKSLA